MKIEINLKIVFALLLFLMIKNLNTYLIFLIFILIHEFAHLIVGITLGGKPKKMVISVFGVSLEFYSYVKAKSFYKIIFYAIGPITNILIALLLSCIYTEKNLLIEKIITTNYMIGIFNLIPILPLDGGKIVKEIFKIFFKLETANKISIYGSKVILTIVSLVYSVLIIKIKNIAILFLIIYLWYLYTLEERKFLIYLKTNNAIKKMI